MNIENIASALESWMKVDTWYTTHPLDERRFHQALAVVFQENGFAISRDDFRDALYHLAGALPSGKLEKEFLGQEVERLAEKAETIASYLKDNSH